jgi:hypothetical protein
MYLHNARSYNARNIRFDSTSNACFGCVRFDGCACVSVAALGLQLLWVEGLRHWLCTTVALHHCGFAPLKLFSAMRTKISFRQSMRNQHQVPAIVSGKHAY